MRATLLALLLALSTATALNYLPPARYEEFTVEDLLTKFTNLQPDNYRKVAQHFLIEEVARLRARRHLEQQIKERVLQWMSDPRAQLLQRLTKYMQDRLFKKLDMGQLTPTLVKEVLEDPEKFYLSFDVYDLLFD